MQKKTFTILFFIKRTKLLRDGKAPIYLRITIDGVRAEIGIHRSINPSDWLEKKGSAKATTPQNKQLNQYLEQIRYRIYAIQKDIYDDGKTLTAELIKNRYLGINETNVTFVELYSEHNQKLKERIGKDIAKATLTRHETSMKHVVEFLQYKYHKNDILLKDITVDFIMEYEHYLKTIRNCAHNTTIKYIRNMGKILRLAEQKDIIKKNPLDKITYKKDVVEKEYLTEEELDLLLNKDFALDRLTNIRDVFAFCSYTGLAFIDVKQLRKEDITIVDGVTVIRKQRRKTRVYYFVPLLPIAKQILEKYENSFLPNNQLLPVPSNTKMNAYLKEVADICGITKNLTTHVARHTFASTVTLAHNISIESVSKMLGHSDIKMTQHYAKVQEKTVLREMGELSGKLNYSY